MYTIAMRVHRKTTLITDDRLLYEARKAIGIKEKTALIRAGLELLVAREAA